MSTITAPLPTPATPGRPSEPGRRVPVGKVTGRRVLRSEWSKQWSLRSTWITLALGVLFLIAFGVISALHYTSELNSSNPRGPEFENATGYSIALFGVPFALIALGVLGVLATSGEYTSGMIRSTLAAVPRRLPVLWSKAAIYGVSAFCVGAIGAVCAFLIGSSLLSGTAVAMSISDSGVVRGLLGAGVYLGLVGVIGVAFGAILRSTAGGISVLVATFLLVPGLMSLLPSSWQSDINQYLPSSAGESIFALQHTTGTLSAGAGLLVMLGWTVLALAGAAYRLMRSDA